jgi:hypothetical protein
VSFTALQIFAGAVVTPMTAPLPFHAYPALVETLAGWVWTLLRAGDAPPAAA